MQKEKDEYKDHSRLRHVLFMVLAAICSGIAVWITAPLADGDEFSWNKIIPGNTGKGTGSTSGGGDYVSNEEPGNPDEIFSSAPSNSYNARRNSSGYTPTAARTSIPTNNSTGTYTPGNLYPGRNIIITNQTMAQGQPERGVGGGGGIVTNSETSSQTYNNSSALAVMQPRPNKQNITEGVSKVAKAVTVVIHTAREAGNSNPPALPPDGGDPVDVPIDGGLSLFIAAGLGSGLIKAYRSKKISRRNRKNIG